MYSAVPVLHSKTLGFQPCASMANSPAVSMFGQGHYPLAEDQLFLSIGSPPPRCNDLLSMNRSQKAVDSSIADLAAVLDPLRHRLAEVIPDQDARESILLCRLSEARV
jgi:hypothetical protein